MGIFLQQHACIANIPHMYASSHHSSCVTSIFFTHAHIALHNALWHDMKKKKREKGKCAAELPYECLCYIQMQVRTFFVSIQFPVRFVTFQGIHAHIF